MPGDPLRGCPSQDELVPAYRFTRYSALRWWPKYASIIIVQWNLKPSKFSEELARHGIGVRGMYGDPDQARERNMIAHVHFVLAQLGPFGPHVFGGKDGHCRIDEDGKPIRLAKRVDVGLGTEPMKKYQTVVRHTVTIQHDIKIRTNRAVLAPCRRHQPTFQNSRQAIMSGHVGFSRVATRRVKQIAKLPEGFDLFPPAGESDPSCNAVINSLHAVCNTARRLEAYAAGTTVASARSVFASPAAFPAPLSPLNCTT